MFWSEGEHSVECVGCEWCEKGVIVFLLEWSGEREVVDEVLSCKGTRGFGSVELGVERGGYRDHPICGGGLGIADWIHEGWDVAFNHSLLECVEKILCVVFALFLPLYSGSERNSV